MNYSTLLVDLDETLYPTNSGLWDAIAERIDRYMQDVLSFHPEEIYQIRTELFHKYGTTLKGLQSVCQVDKHDYLQFVHDVPLERFLKPNPALRQILQRYQQRRLIFTNADAPHANRVLAALGLEELFDGIIDIHDIAPHCKPEPEAYQIALERAGCASGSECILIDDKLSNLAPARRLGIYTIWVGGSHAQPECDASIAVIEDLPRVLDPLLSNGNQPRAQSAGMGG